MEEEQPRTRTVIGIRQVVPTTVNPALTFTASALMVCERSRIENDAPLDAEHVLELHLLAVIAVRVCLLAVRLQRPELATITIDSRNLIKFKGVQIGVRRMFLLIQASSENVGCLF